MIVYKGELICSSQPYMLEEYASMKCRIECKCDTCGIEIIKDGITVRQAYIHKLNHANNIAEGTCTDCWDKTLLNNSIINRVPKK